MSTSKRYYVVFFLRYFVAPLYLSYTNQTDIQSYSILRQYRLDNISMFIFQVIMTDNRNIHNLLIDIKNLTRGYPSSSTMLFNKFNFGLYKNDFCVIMWKSGVGKSTLVKFIIWDIKVPLQTIYHKREDLARYSDEEIQFYRRKIGIVFQDYQLMDDLTARQNIVYPLRLYEVDEAVVDHKFKQLKEKLKLHFLQHMPVKFLSGWEKQKVTLARALIHNPEFIIADEPTWNLDREHTQEIADILIESNRLGNTVLLITHDIHLLEYLKHKNQEMKIHEMK